MRMVDRLKSLALALLVCLAIAWLTDRDPPQDYSSVIPLSAGYTVDGRPLPPAAPGGSLAVQYRFSRDRACKLAIYRSISDSQGGLFILPPEIFNPSQIGDQLALRWFDIDRRAFAGPAIAKIDVHSYCNLLQRWIDWPIETTLYVHFTIAGAPADVAQKLR